MTDRTSKTLLLKVRDWSDHASWKRFSETYSRLVYNLAVKAGLPKEDVEEVVQNTMVDVARRIREFDYDPEMGSFRGWLCMRAKAGIREHLRKDAMNRRMFPPRPQAPPDDRTGTTERYPDPAAEPDVFNERDWNVAVADLALEQVRKRVSPRQFQLFDLYAIKGWPVDRVKRALGVSLAQIYLAKGRVALLLKWEIKKVQSRLDRIPMRERRPDSTSSTTL